jgi:hypothetical protein
MHFHGYVINGGRGVWVDGSLGVWEEVFWWIVDGGKWIGFEDRRWRIEDRKAKSQKPRTKNQ